MFVIFNTIMLYFADLNEFQNELAHLGLSLGPFVKSSPLSPTQPKANLYGPQLDMLSGKLRHFNTC